MDLVAAQVDSLLSSLMLTGLRGKDWISSATVLPLPSQEQQGAQRLPTAGFTYKGHIRVQH